MKMRFITSPVFLLATACQGQAQQEGQALNAAIRNLIAQGPSPAQVASARVETVAALRPGDAVPALTLRDADNKPLAVPVGPGSRGRAILFTATWCESYLAETEPATAASCREAREQAGAEAKRGGRDWTVVAAHLWTQPGEMRDFGSEFGGPIHMAFDQDGMAFRRFGIQKFPAVALIGADGRLERIVRPAPDAPSRP
jgi:hypothetical protein